MFIPKLSGRVSHIPVDKVSYEFAVGCGLDFYENYRNLHYIGS